MPAVRHRRYVFTWNNYDQASEDYLATLPCRFIIYGKEIAPETGTPHLQGFVCFNNAKTERAARGILRGCHVDVARSTVAANIAYCSKSGDVFQRGDPPADPGICFFV